MNDQTDSQLLRAYAEHRAEPAFAELVRRHVDFVYSAALRMVCDSHLAEDVTQGVFVALAKQAVQLANRPVLSGWLHGTARNIAAQTVRTDVRRRAREQEAVAMNELIAGDPEAGWEQIAPQLDAALGELDESDRDALLLRYFERKSAQEMAQTLGISDEAAQKRVSRAVEKLREFFSKRKITIGTSGLAVLISANAVQSAPIGLLATISAAAVLTGTAAHTSTVIAATKTIAMTTLQKSIIGTTIAVVAGTGIFAMHKASQLREQNQVLQRQQTSLSDQVQQLQRERDDATNQLAGLLMENAQLKSNSNENELLRLRGEVTRLRKESQELSQLRAVADDQTEAIAKDWLNRVNQLHHELDQREDKKIPELQFLTKKDWFEAANDADLTTEDGIRDALSNLRSIAKGKFASRMSEALRDYTKDNDGQLPTIVSELKPYFQPAVEDSILQRYEMLQAGKVNETGGKSLVTEIAPVDVAFDTRYYISTTGYMGAGVDTYSPTNRFNIQNPPVGR